MLVVRGYFVTNLFCFHKLRLDYSMSNPVYMGGGVGVDHTLCGCLHCIHTVNQKGHALDKLSRFNSE